MSGRGPLLDEWVLCCHSSLGPLSSGGAPTVVLTLPSPPELEPRGQQPVAKAEGSPTAILIGCLVAIILLLLLIIALMLWRLHWRRLLSKASGAGAGGRGAGAGVRPGRDRQGVGVESEARPRPSCVGTPALVWVLQGPQHTVSLE